MGLVAGVGSHLGRTLLFGEALFRVELAMTQTLMKHTH